MKEPIISDKALERIETELSKGGHWVAINRLSCVIEEQDMFFFERKDEALEFKSNNISDYDSFSVIHALSVKDALRQITYGEKVYEQLTSDPDANPLYNKDGNAFTDQLINHIEKEQRLNNSKTNTMNQKNLDILKDNLKYLGFGDKPYAELEKNIKAGLPDFTIKVNTGYGKDIVEANLQFRKGNESDMYFFNRYDATLKTDTLKEDRSHTFYINKGHGVTLKEAYNLLLGRAVNKDLSNSEGQMYNAWIQLDLKNKDDKGQFIQKQFHQNYGYDLEAVLRKHPIKELQDDNDREKLLYSLNKGNLQSVTFLTESGQEKRFIEAAPQYKTIQMYDEQLKPIRNQTQGQEKNTSVVNEPQQQLNKREKKQTPTADDDDGPGLKKKRTRKNGMKMH